MGEPIILIGGKNMILLIIKQAIKGVKYVTLS
jgi:hypothetical protein